MGSTVVLCQEGSKLLLVGKKLLAVGVGGLLGLRVPVEELLVAYRIEQVLELGYGEVIGPLALADMRTVFCIGTVSVTRRSEALESTIVACV